MRKKQKEFKKEALQIATGLSGSITSKAKYICKVLGVEYTDTRRRLLSKWLRELNPPLTDDSNVIHRHSGVSEVAKEVGIPTESISAYWYKGKYYSILARNNKDTFDWDDLVEQLSEKVAAHAPVYKKFDRTPGDDNTLLVIDCADIHIGKLATAYTSGENYNIDIAKKQVFDGVRGIMSKAANFNISKVLLVIGNDVIHTDNAKSTTTSGTFQDSSDMLTTMFNEALDMYVQIIDSLMPEYDVDVVHNSSNHDYLTGWMLARCIDAWYRNAPNVKVDSGIIHRKYYQFGTNMICTSHGDGAKMQDLPLLMANEAPEMWAGTKYRYAYLHHIHHKQVTKFQSGKDYIGVTVEYLRSPSPADRWHHDNGYVGAKKAVEGFVHSYNNGQIARITHYF